MAETPQWMSSTDQCVAKRPVSGSGATGKSKARKKAGKLGYSAGASALSPSGGDLAPEPGIGGKVSTTGLDVTGSKGGVGYDNDGETKTASGAATLTHGEGDAKRAAGVGASAGRDADGGVTLGLKGHVQTGDMKISGGVSTGRTAKVVRGADAGGKIVYVMKYESSRSESGGLSGKSVGGSGSRGKTTKGERVYSTRAEAEAASTAFKATGKMAAALGIGDSRTVTAHGGTSADVGGSVGVAGVTVGGGVTEGTAATVKRVSKTVAHITVGASTTVAGGASLSVPGAGAGLTRSGTTGANRTVSVDLTTKAGKAAYEAVLAGKALPKTGWTQISRTATTAMTNGTQAQLGPLGRSSSATVTHQTTRDQHGVSKRTDGENKQGVSALIAHHKENNRLTGTSRNKKNRQWAFNAGVDSSSAGSASHVLAAATGTTAKKNLSGKPAGKWSVVLVLTDKQIETFVKHMQGVSPKMAKSVAIAGGTTVVGSATKDTESLIRALKAAGSDKAKWRQALALWVAHAGEHAREQLKHYSGATPQYHVKLEDSPYFTGAAGRRALDAQIAALRKRPNQSQIAELLRDQLKKKSLLMDSRKLKELPDELRARELTRTRQDIGALRALKGRAKNGKGSPKKEQTCEAPKPAVYTPDQALKDRLRALQGGITRFRALAAHYQHSLTLSKQVHNYDPEPWRRASQSLRERFSGSQKSAYEAANKHENAAMAALALAHKEEATLLDLENATGETQLQGAVTSASAVVAGYQKVVAALQYADQKYKEIEKSTGCSHRRGAYLKKA